jgi:prepilin-type N-terminal cleavage/methylation domain-containing protein
MDESMSYPNPRRESGFTLLETILAMVILTVGMLALASLFAKTTLTSNMSRYMSTQSLLASEKLDDLNRLSEKLPPTLPPPEIAVPGGGVAGSLTADTSAVVTSGVTQDVDYFDTVQISAGNTGVSETFTGLNGGGQTTYTTVTHSPNGGVNSVTGTVAPVAPPDAINFKRRWVIEQDVPVVGVRRITVRVTVMDVPNAVPFQLSMVRP